MPIYQAELGLLEINDKYPIIASTGNSAQKQCITGSMFKTLDIIESVTKCCQPSPML